MTKPLPRPPVVLIAGGGWAGLAAAVTLTRQRIPVMLLESARQLGGRARSVLMGERVLDNGQHLVLGACRSLLELMRQIGVDTDAAFARLPLTLSMHGLHKPGLRLRAARLPAPLHLLGALGGARGLNAGERLRALRFGRRLLQSELDVDADISVQTLLQAHAQTPELVRKLWAPLCLASLNTPPDIASARLFVAVLQSVVAGRGRDADLLIPRQELNALLPRPAAEFLDRQGSSIELGQRVTAVELAEARALALRVGDRRMVAHHFILATPPVITRRLLGQHQALRSLADRLAALGSEPVATLYLQYPPQIRLATPMTGLLDGLAQWVFDRGVCGQPGLMAVVISGRGEHSRLPAETLASRVKQELARHFPHWPASIDYRLMRERRATFCARVGVDKLRPANHTPVSNLWLAGDYTATGLPATLESAVHSGEQCARAVIRSLGEANMLD